MTIAKPSPTTSPATDAADRPFLGVLLMLGFCVMAPMGDAIAKIIGDAVALSVLLLARFAIQAAVLLPLSAVLGLQLWAGWRHFWLNGLRSIFHIAGIGLMFSALRFLPLADAIAIAFVMPFLMLLLGRFVLGEVVGPHRLGACAVGFGGTLMVIQPNLVEVGLPALLPLGVAVVFSLFMLATRLVARAVDPVALQAVSGAQATVVIGAALVLWPLVTPTNWHGIADVSTLWRGGAPMGTLLALGLMGTVAHLLMSASLRFAPSATLAPMQYLEIPIGTLIGWIVFSDLPNGLAAAGIVVTIAAGLYIIGRERRTASALSAPPADPSAAGPAPKVP